MKIEVGKTYDVSAMWKKSTYEIEMYKNKETEQSLNTEIGWRSGSFRVTIQNEDEATALQQCIGEDGEIWDFEEYEEIELLETWDGCWEEFIFYGPNWTEESQEELEASWEENQESDDGAFSRYEFLEDNGWESIDCNFQIHGGVIVEESEETVGVTVGIDEEDETIDYTV